MKGAVGIPLVVFAAGLVILGIALGAATQNESIQGEQGAEKEEAAGNLVPLTSFLTGVGALIFAAAIGRAPWRRRAGGALEVGFATWILLALVQGDFPNFETVEGSGIINLGESTLIATGGGVATILLPVIAAGLALMFAILDGFRRVMNGSQNVDSLPAMRAPLLASAALAIPFLAVLVTGALQLMLSIPGTNEAAALAYLLLPVAAVAAVAWIVVLLLRVHHFYAVSTDARLAPFTREAWHILGRIEWAVIAVMGAAAIASSALPATDTAATSAGRTLILTLRSHGQGLLFILVPLLPAILNARRIAPLLEDVESMEPPATRPMWGLVAASIVSVLAAFIAGFAEATLLPWMLASIPLAVFAGVHCAPRLALPTMAVASWVLWARGNAIAARYDASSFPTLEFGLHPGLLALCRMAGVGLAAWALYRWVTTMGGSQRRAVVIPLALVIAVGLALMALLEMPLWIWDEGRVPVNKLAVGALLRSQALGVQVVIHMFSVVATVGAALSAARLVRPEWFARKAVPADAPNAAAA